MRAVVQRVSEASVSVHGEELSRIGRGLMVLIGVEVGDEEKDARYLGEKLAKLRIFEDAQGKMNLSLQDVGGEALLISQFTLLGDARGQNRPGFTQAQRPETAEPLYELCCNALRAMGVPIRQGSFGADMQVALINDGPVTILLDSRKNF